MRKSPWLERIMVALVSWWYPIRNFSRTCWSCASRWDPGSSRMSICGLWTNARMRLTLSRCPAESSLRGVFSYGFISNISRRELYHSESILTDWIFASIIRLSSTFIDSKKSISTKWYQNSLKRSLCRLLSGVVSRDISHFSGVRIPEISFRKVVFPLPDGQERRICSHFLIMQEKPSTILSLL